MALSNRDLQIKGFGRSIWQQEGRLTKTAQKTSKKAITRYQKVDKSHEMQEDARRVFHLSCYSHLNIMLIGPKHRDHHSKAVCWGC